uniref:Uncharacterized protein n=1 Tax=Micrurus surinamensis TaxID=129470 RepID=A0A2D4NT88_MICSU
MADTKGITQLIPCTKTGKQSLMSGTIVTIIYYYLLLFVFSNVLKMLVFYSFFLFVFFEAEEHNLKKNTLFSTVLRLYSQMTYVIPLYYFNGATDTVAYFSVFFFIKNKLL